MKILQVNCHYNYGSTGKIMYDIDSYLSSQNIVSLQCYARGKKIKKNHVYKIAYEPICKLGKLINYLYGRPFAWGSYSTKKLINIIERESPDVIHLHCINAYTLNIYKLLNYLKANNIKTLITLHAEFLHTGGCSYAFECNQWKSEIGCKKCEDSLRSGAVVKRTSSNWAEMKSAFEDFDRDSLILASVSPWLKNRAMKSQILKGYNHRVVLNGIDTDIFKMCSQSEIEFVRKKYNLNVDKILLHVTSDFNAPIKGGKYIIDLAQLLKENDVNAEIIVIGPVKNCKNYENYKNIKFLGVIRDQKELAIFYSMAQMTILTSQKETFSMICAESLCCGTPIIGFKAGAPETIALPEYSYFYEFANIMALFIKVKEMLYTDSYDANQISEIAKETYSAKRMAKNYLSLYKELINV